ncbi:MAG TPA: tetratricopeptide repeat protein [Burkholderiaceae bacterium]
MPPALPQDQRSELIALFKAGRYADLEARAHFLVTQFADDPLVWKSLSAALQMQGKNALQAMQMTTRLTPGDAAEHCNLAAALLKLRRCEEAVESCRRALQIQPSMIEAHSNLGSALQQLGQLGDAAASYRAALEYYPRSAQFHNSLGMVLRQQGHLEASIGSFRQALLLAPNFAIAHHNLGNALHAAGINEEALATLRRGVELDPLACEIHSDLGNLLGAFGCLEEALDCFDKALALQPERAEVHNNRATVLLDCGRLAEAERALRHAIVLRPRFAEAHCNLGDVLREARKISEAANQYRLALAINPGLTVAHNNLGVACRDLGEMPTAIASFKRAIEQRPDYLNARSNLLLTCNYLTNIPAADALKLAQEYGAVAQRLARPCTHWPNVIDATRSLRIGLVSGDLCRHPVGYFLDSVLHAVAAHAGERLQFVAYMSRHTGDATTERLKKNCRAWRDVAGWSDQKLAQCIQQDAIDILIDLSGHTAHNRLPMFAWKPAPLQVSWLGYFATTGIAAMDYVLADPWTAPASVQANFVETIWRLPETRLCFTPPAEAADVAPLPAMNNGYLTFGSFGNLTKMSDAVVALWSAILLAVPGSRLYLKAKQLDEQSTRLQVLERFAANGIASERLTFDGYSTRSSYLSSYSKVDIVLDTFPFPGGTTTMEALWMGVPVLTMTGESFVARQGVSLLMNAGLAQWIAADPDDFARLAVKHAANLPSLAVLRTLLRQQLEASPLLDAPRFAGHFESALRAMWVRWCAQQAQ